MSVKWCVIGAGGIADRRTIPAILSDGESRLEAVMDRKGETAEKIGKKYSVPYFTSEREMLEKTDCDAVYIGTPVKCHFEQAMACLEYGRHVFMEKPIGLNAAEGEKLVGAFKKQGKQLTVGYMMKYHNLHVKAKKLVSEGKIGAVNDVRLQFSCWYPEIEGAWRQKKSLGGGGAVMDLGVHCIELIEYILGEEISETKSFLSRRTFSYEVEDGGVIAFRTKSGVLGHIDVNFNLPDKASVSKMEIYGTEGYVNCFGTLGQEEKGKMLFLRSPQGEYSAKQERTSDKPETYYGNGGNLYLKQLKDFTKIIRNKKPDYKYAERAVQVQKIVDGIYSGN